MSQENVDLVRRVFAEFSDSPVVAVDDAARAGLVAPDIEFDFSALYPDGPILRGVEAWRWFADTLPWGRSLTLKSERFYDVDDELVLVFVRATAEGKGSGVPVENRTAHVFTIRDGVFVRWKVYADRAEALEAAGLRE
jgi:ketosteroid isomerase-like protein